MELPFKSPAASAATATTNTPKMVFESFPQDQKPKHHISAHTVWTITKIVIVLAIIGLIIYAVVKYWKYIEIAGLVLGAALAAAALAPILIPIIAGLLGLAVAAFGYMSGRSKKGIELSDQAKEAGDDAKADQIKSETKDTLQEKTNAVNEQIVDAQNQGVPNVTINEVPVATSGASAFSDGEDAGKNSFGPDGGGGD